MITLGLVGLVILVVVGHLVLAHRGATLTEARKVDAATAAVAAKVAGAEEAVRDAKTVDAGLRQLSAEMPPTPDTAQFVTDLSTIAAAAGVRVLSAAPGDASAAPAQSAAGLSSTQFSVSVNGTLPAVTRFVGLLESAPRLATVTAVSDTWLAHTVTAEMAVEVYSWD